MNREEGLFLYDIVLNKKVPQGHLRLIKENLNRRNSVQTISNALNNDPYSKEHGIEYSPWIVSYLIKQHNLDGSGVQLTSLEKNILFYAINPDRISIISKTYFNGTNLGFVDNIYGKIGILPE